MQSTLGNMHYCLLKYCSWHTAVETFDSLDFVMELCWTTLFVTIVSFLRRSSLSLSQIVPKKRSVQGGQLQYETDFLHMFVGMKIKIKSIIIFSKQYIAFKKMTRAALIIQSQYRTYREHERFKKSRRAAAIIQNTFRSYRERRRSSQRRREQRLTKRQEARYMQKVSNR